METQISLSSVTNGQHIMILYTDFGSNDVGFFTEPTYEISTEYVDSHPFKLKEPLSPGDISCTLIWKPNASHLYNYY